MGEGAKSLGENMLASSFIKFMVVTDSALGHSH